MNEINSISGPMLPSWMRLVDDLEQGKSLYDELANRYTFNAERFICDLSEAVNHKDHIIHLRTIKLFQHENENIIIPKANEIYNLVLKIVMCSNLIWKDSIPHTVAYSAIDALFDSSWYNPSPATLQKLIDAETDVRTFVLATVKLVPSVEKSKEIIEAAISLYDDTDCFEEKQRIFEALATIQTKEMANIVAVSGNLLKGVVDSRDKIEILYALELIPRQDRTQKCVENLITINSVLGSLRGYNIQSSERADVFEWTANILRTFPSSEIIRKNASKIIVFISKVAREERKELFPRLDPYLSKIKNSSVSIMNSFFDLIELLDLGEKAKISDDLLQTITVFSTGGYIDRLIEILKGSQNKKTVGFLQGILHICKPNTDRFFLGKLNNLLDSLNDVDIIEKSGPLLKDIDHFITKLHALWFVSLIARQHRTPNNIQNIITFWNQYTTLHISQEGYAPTEIVRDELGSLLSLGALMEERSDFMEKVVHYLDHFTTTKQTETFFKIVARISKKERTLQNLDNIIAIHLACIGLGSEKISFLENILSYVSVSELPDIAAKTLPYVEYFKESDQLMMFMSGLETIPMQERKSLLESLKPHIQEKTENIGFIIKILSIIPVHERTDLMIHALRILFTRPIRVQAVREILMSILEAERSDFIEKTLPLIQNLSKTDGFVESTLAIVALLPAKDRRYDNIRAIRSLFFSDDRQRDSTIIKICIRDIPEDLRARAILRACPYFSDINSHIRAALLYACGFEEGIEVFQNPPQELEDIIYRSERIIAKLILTFIRPEQRAPCVVIKTSGGST